MLTDLQGAEPKAVTLQATPGHHLLAWWAVVWLDAWSAPGYWFCSLVLPPWRLGGRSLTDLW